MDTRSSGPGTLRAAVDPRRIDVVTANLFGNALRHGAAPVRLTLGRRKEETGVEWAVIEVTDNGPGIAEEALPHVFERFCEASASRIKKRQQGPRPGHHGGERTPARWPCPGGEPPNRGGAVFTVELPLRHDATEEYLAGDAR